MRKGGTHRNPQKGNILQFLKHSSKSNSFYFLQKLLWAVAEALRGKGIGINHPQFKQYGSRLALTVKKLMPDLENRNIPRKPGSTSDRMLKFAKQCVLAIVDAKPTNC